MRHTLTCMVAMVLSCSVLAASSSIFAQGMAQPPQSRFQLLPAVLEPPETLAKRQEAENALKNINEGRLNNAQLRNMLLSHPNPAIRAKAQRAAQGMPGIPHQAGPEPPEIMAQVQKAETALSNINQGRLSSLQLRQMLLNYPGPRIRENAREAQRVSQQPRGSLDSQERFASLSSLWSWLNPWTVSNAQAQVGGTTKPSPKYAFTLSPQRRYVPPSNEIDLLGPSLWMGSPGFSGYLLQTGSNGSVGEPAALGFSVVRPLVILRAWLPRNGWYLIDFYGSGRPKASLRHGSAQLPVLESWDMTGQPLGFNYNHFATVEYLAQGNHHFYFTVDQGQLWFYEVSVEEF